MQAKIETLLGYSLKLVEMVNGARVTGGMNHPKFFAQCTSGWNDNAPYTKFGPSTSVEELR